MSIPVTDNGEAVKTPSTLSRVISYIPYGEIFAPPNPTIARNQKK